MKEKKLLVHPTLATDHYYVRRGHARDRERVGSGARGYRVAPWGGDRNARGAHTRDARKPTCTVRTRPSILIERDPGLKTGPLPIPPPQHNITFPWNREPRRSGIERIAIFFWCADDSA